VDVLRSFLSQIDHMEKDDWLGRSRGWLRSSPIWTAAEAGFRRVGYQ
jgi:hypothetical protein